MNSIRFSVAVGMGGLFFSGQALAVTVPFTETFDGPAANWSSSSVFTAINYVSSGGPDGSSYGSVLASFANNQAGDQPLVVRCQSNFGSSGNNFVGNWITAGVTDLSWSVRQNSGSDVSFFVRFAPSAGPGAVALAPVVAHSGEWTTFHVVIDPSTPFIYEGTNFTSTFSNVARLQLGVLVDGNLAGKSGVTIDVDNVGITPAPGTAVLSLAGLALVRRRR